MNVLTKTFVVLVTILSVLLVALVVPFVAEQGDKQTTINKLNTDIAVEREKAVQQVNEIEATRDAANAALALIKEDMSELVQQKDSLTQQREQLASQLAAQEAEARRQTATANSATAMAEAEQKRNATLVEQLGTDRAELLKLAQEKSQLNQTITGLNEDNAILVANVRRLQEDLLASQQELSDLRVVVGERRAPEPRLEEDIEAQVTEVRENRGVTFVQINVGTRDGVLKDMRFTLEREGQYLGDLVVRAVEQGQSVGIIEQMQDQPQQGDIATTRNAAL